MAQDPRTRSWSCDLNISVSRSKTSRELRKRTTQLIRKSSSRLASERSTTEFLTRSRSTGVSKEFIATARSASETILNREALEENDELETDIQAFAELEEDSVGLGKGDGNWESHSKRQFDHQEVPGDDEADETDLRSRLEDACVGQEHGNRFLPARELDKLLTEQTIRRTMLASNPDGPVLAEVLSDTCPSLPPSQSLRKLFAVLTLLDRVGDISHFLSNGVRDANLPLSGELLKRIWPEDDLQASAEFERRQWQVLAPFFETGSGDSPKVYHYSLDHRAILPFSSPSDTPIRGGFGTVSKVRIHRSHISPDLLANGDTLVAVKTLRKSPENDRAFARERSALRRFGRHNAQDSSHLVKLLATFKHGDSYSLIFPWAEKDLVKYWQSEPDERHSGVTLGWLAQQCLGLAKAVQSIHTLGGRHGDIKPENILWFPGDANTSSGSPGGTLVITDFGLARFHDDQSGFRRPQKLSGTPTYRPPEVDLIDGSISRSYDMWSLGCLWLEFITWYLLGSDGVLADFPRARTQTLDPGQLQDTPDDCFFTLRGQDGNGIAIQPSLKPSVRNQFRELRQHPFSSKFISDFLDLIEFGMLETSPEKRLNSLSCIQALEPLRSKLNLDHNYGKSRSIFTLEMPPPTGEGHQRRRITSWQTECPPGFVLEEDSDRLDFTLHEGVPADNLGSRFDAFRRWLDKQAGAEIDWWPLPPVHQPLPQGHSRVTWVYGGRQMSITLDPDTARRWSNGSTGGNGSPAPVLPSWTAPPAGTGTPISAKTPPSAGTTIQHHLTTLWNWASQKRAFFKTSTTAPKPPQPPPAPTSWREAYLCADRAWTSITETKLSTLSHIDTMADDCALFTEARRVLDRAEGNRVQRFLSWRSYTRVHLSQFHFLFNNSDRVKTFPCAALALALRNNNHHNTNHTHPLPADMICRGYEFSAQHREVDIHMQIMAETILQGIRRPALGRGQRTVLGGIPKLKAPPGLRKQAEESGWGFHAGQGPCVVRMFGWVWAAMGLGLLFVPVWLASVSALDLQGAFAPVSFLLTALGVMVAVSCLVQEGAVG